MANMPKELIGSLLSSGNLDRSVKLAELADVACFSEFHFHRIFRAVSGEALNSFTNRRRWSHFELELCLPVRKAAEMRS